MDRSRLSARSVRKVGEEKDEKRTINRTEKIQGRREVRGQYRKCKLSIYLFSLLKVLCIVAESSSLVKTSTKPLNELILEWTAYLVPLL